MHNYGTTLLAIMYLICLRVLLDLDSFPTMVRQGTDTSSLDRQVSRKPIEQLHETEIIFILPSLDMHLKTEHMQAEKEPVDNGLLHPYLFNNTITG